MKEVTHVVAIWIIFLITGCNNQDIVAPQITLSSPKLIDGQYEASENEKIEVNVNVEIPGGFNLLRMDFEGINRASEEVVKNETGQTVFNYDFEMENWLYGTTPFEILFTAVDDSNNSSQAKITVFPGEPGVTILDENPDIEGDTLYAFVGQQYNVGYRYTFPSGFAKFRNIFEVDGNTTSEIIITTLPATQGTSVTDQISQTLTSDFLGKQLSYHLEVTDKFSNSASLELPIKLVQKPTTKFNAITLAAPASDNSSESFFSANTGLVYSVTQVNSSADIPVNIDFGYFYTDSEKSSFTGPANFPTNIYNVGPNGENWSPLNVTNFRRTSLSGLNFDALDEDSQSEIDAAYDDSTSGTELVITNLAEGEVVAFKTSSNKLTGSKRGLFKVVSITAGANPDGKIVIDVIANQ